MDRAFVAATLIVVLASWTPHLSAVAAAQAPPDDAGSPAKFSADQIDQMVAPVALYPDALLAQIMIASTYPLEIVEADRWRRQNASLKDDALDKALEQKDWDPSVKGLTKMPDLLKRMSENLDWTKDLGDAFLAQKDDVMAAVQEMRRKASEAGNLKTSQQQTVTKEVVNNKETIVIQPADPEVVYVPSYPPTVYGPTYAPPAPVYAAPVYGYTPGQVAMTGMLSFGAGVAVGALVSDGFGWGSNDVHVNNNYYGGGGGGGGGGGSNNNTNVNIDKSKTNNWQHNPEHRRNVDYRDKSTQKKFESRNPNAARDKQVREQARGFEQGGDRNRGGQAGTREAGNRGGQTGSRDQGRGDRGAQAGTRDQGRGGDRGGQAGSRDMARGDRGGGGDRGGAGGAGGGRAQTRPSSGGKSGAFGDYGSGQSSRQASQRGASSRGGQSYAGSGGGGRGGGGGGGGGGGRGGGGGGRGGGGGGRRR
jgi:Protein of unknown function (DUF3300)